VCPQYLLIGLFVLQKVGHSLLIDIFLRMMVQVYYVRREYHVQTKGGGHHGHEYFLQRRLGDATTTAHHSTIDDVKTSTAAVSQTGGEGTRG
jgi:hypothetical protein